VGGPSGSCSGSAVKACHRCQADLQGVDGRLVKVNQITELPDPKAEVIEVRQYETRCPQCGQVQVKDHRPDWKWSARLGRGWKPRWCIIAGTAHEL